MRMWSRELHEQLAELTHGHEFELWQHAQHAQRKICGPATPVPLASHGIGTLAHRLRENVEAPAPQRNSCARAVRLAARAAARRVLSLDP